MFSKCSLSGVFSPLALADLTENICALWLTHHSVDRSFKYTKSDQNKLR